MGMSEKIVRGMELVESSIHSMNAKINRILVELRKNRVTKSELPGEVAVMGGIRDDWVVKKRRIIDRNKVEWLESDRVAEIISVTNRTVSNSIHDMDYPFIDYGTNDKQPDTENPVILLSDTDNEQPEIQKTTFAENTPPSTVHKGREQPDSLPGHDLMDVDASRIYDEAFGESVRGSREESPINRNSSASPIVFNSESRSQVLSRMKIKYATTEFYGGIARKNLFYAKTRPMVMDWIEFLNKGIADRILVTRIHRGKKIYRFVN